MRGAEKGCQPHLRAFHQHLDISPPGGVQPCVIRNQPHSLSPERSKLLLFKHIDAQFHLRGIRAKSRLAGTNLMHAGQL